MEKKWDRYIPPTLVSGVFLLMLLLYSGKAQLMLSDTDFWWHIKAGEIISKLGQIPQYDSFSFSNPQFVWLNISWLWDVVYHYLYQLSGLYLPLVFTMLCNAFTMAMLVWFMQVRGANVIAIAVTFVLCVASYSYMITPRPHAVTFLMSAIFYIITHQAMAGKNNRLLFILPLLMIIWVNCHGGFLIGFIVLGAYLLESLIKRNFSNAKLLILTIFACGLAIFINPLGIDIIAACLRTLSGAMITYVSEWIPLQFSAKNTPHFIYIFSVILLFNPWSKNISLAEKLLAIFWIYSSFQHERNIPLGIIFSAPILAMMLDEKFKKLPASFYAGLQRKNNDYANDLAKKAPQQLLAILSIVAVVFMLSGVNKNWLHMQVPANHPLEEAQYLVKNYENLSIFNDFSVGGYLVFALDGSSKIFIDGRAETAYSNEVITDYISFLNCEENWHKIIEKYSFDAAIIPYKSSCGIKYFSTNIAWGKVFSGKYGDVYIRKGKIKTENKAL